ncbi:MAG: hypothetical protein RMJ56_06045 [Gemmataceae bacterium]|nr:hypothetical protein [Gemmata sp.]MDW8197151.1 hypothetical protein [Gemmataceae bacterium]
MNGMRLVTVGWVTIVLGLSSLQADEKADMAKLVGKWEVTKSGGDTPVGTIVSFEKDGKMTATVNLEGKELKLSGTYKLMEKKLKVSLKLNEELFEHEFEFKWKSDEELELIDGDKVDTLKKKK